MNWVSIENYNGNKRLNDFVIKPSMNWYMAWLIVVSLSYWYSFLNLKFTQLIFSISKSIAYDFDFKPIFHLINCSRMTLSREIIFIVLEKRQPRQDGNDSGEVQFLPSNSFGFLSVLFSSPALYLRSYIRDELKSPNTSFL